MTPKSPVYKYLNLRLYDVDYNVQTTGSEDLSATMKTYYEMQLIRYAEPKLVYDQFGQRKPIPKNRGKTIEFRRFSQLPKMLTPLVEGVTPTGQSLEMAALTATVKQYGGYVTISDILDMTALDPQIEEANIELAGQAGRTLDTITRDIVTAGTNKMFCPSVASNGTETEILLREDVTAACTLRPKDIRLAVSRLKRMNADTISGNFYAAVIHTDVSLDIQNSEDWRQTHMYARPDEIYRGEIGEIGGCRFVETTEGKIIGPAVISDGINRLHVAVAALADATTVYVDEVLTPATPTTAIPVYLNGVSNTITKIEAGGDYGSKLTIGTALPTGGVAVDKIICGKGAGKDGSAIYCTMFFGRNAYGITELTGGGLQFIFKPLGSAGAADPLNQRATTGWKATKVAERLIEEYMLRAEHSSAEYALEAVSN